MAGPFFENDPDKIEDFKKRVNRKDNYRDRLTAIDILGAHKCRQSIDILWRLMISDKVHKVQTAAFLKLQAFGEDVNLPKTNGKHFKMAVEKAKKVNEKISFVRDRDEFYRLFRGLYPEEFDILDYAKNEAILNKYIKEGKLDEYLAKILR